MDKDARRFHPDFDTEWVDLHRVILVAVRLMSTQQRKFVDAMGHRDIFKTQSDRAEED